ncbi:MAG: hypothetical protein GTN86_01455 [Xanthomonadales bacterium]|nr:hypothetical protein [Xanthomonadales bacterium]NIN58507.1 hypothetical protein [Xanthomonadales bacterium]NIN73796.1 hypothetical protein [Xanthomonadales bacterium]NIO13104.1 hypothetical protein [Xanthomonadales bacterium]NIP10900.1 hypothetical protein [Xanthomonadales bacterium]
MNLFAELKRRNVFRVGIAYIVVAWLILQVSEILVPALRLPDWVLTATLYFLIIGFFPALVFAWAFEMTPEGLKKEKEVDRAMSITKQTGRKLDFAIIGLLAVAVVYLVLDKIREPSAPAEPATMADAASDATAEPEVVVETQTKSIAVLPFANMSEDAGNEFFADGISEEILNALARVRELKVAGRTSSFAFKGRNEDLRLIGDTLNVSHILEGSVRKAGNTVRVTAQLIKVDDGFHLWSDTYDRELTDIFAIQDEIAGSILQALKTELIGGETIASAKTDPRAYEKYLRARQLMYTRTRENLEQALAMLEEAMALDEAFAPAWAQRGIVAMLLSDHQYGTIPDRDAQAQAKRYLEHALELDDGLAEAWAGLGLNYDNEPGEENLARAEEFLERALEINPSMLDASNWLANTYRDQYRLADELALREQAFERDPLYTPMIGNLHVAYMTTGQYQKFGRVLDRVRPFLQGHPSLSMYEALMRTNQGDNAGALPFAEAAYAAAPTNDFVAGAWVRALTFLNEFERVVAISRANPNWHIVSLQQLGRLEEATLMARQWFEASGAVWPLFQMWVNAGKYEAIVAFTEQRWPDLAAFRNDVPGAVGFGYGEMGFLAKAYLETGRLQKFSEAMQIIREVHDKQAQQGIGWPFFFMAEAHYWTMADDRERAIDLIEKAVDMNWLATPRISNMWSTLRPLEGHPRFEAAQQRMLDNLNRDRANAGLEPLEPGYSL